MQPVRCCLRILSSHKRGATRGTGYAVGLTRAIPGARPAGAIASLAIQEWCRFFESGLPPYGGSRSLRRPKRSRFFESGFCRSSNPEVRIAGRATENGAYWLHFWVGAPGRIRTYNSRLRRPMLYPVELRVLVKWWRARIVQKTHRRIKERRTRRPRCSVACWFVEHFRIGKNFSGPRVD